MESRGAVDLRAGDCVLVAKRREVHDAALRSLGLDAFHERAMPGREMAAHDEHIDQPFEPRRQVGAAGLLLELADELADRVTQVLLDLVLRHGPSISPGAITRVRRG
jgi:hypothetical protein